MIYPQIIVVRLQRVTFLALNSFLGLGHELINQASLIIGDNQCSLTVFSYSNAVCPIQKPSLNGHLSVSKLRHNVNRIGDVAAVTSSGVANEENQPPGSIGSTGAAHLVSNNSEGMSPTVSQSNYLSDSVRSTDSEILSDDLSPPAKHKMVAIDTSQNRHFSHKLLPVQSPEFDNVMDQVGDRK